MRVLRAIPFVAIFLSLSACAHSGDVTDGTLARINGRLILIASERAVEQEKTLLELIRLRLPVTVEQGRFRTQDGITNTCVYARRSSARAERTHDANSLSYCPLLAAYIDDVWIGDVGTYLAQVRAAVGESVELLSSSAAMQRYGPSTTGPDVLVLWTRGRGPHAGRNR